MPQQKTNRGGVLHVITLWPLTILYSGSLENGFFLAMGQFNWTPVMEVFVCCGGLMWKWAPAEWLLSENHTYVIKNVFRH